jgi:hypothetical protein
MKKRLFLNGLILLLALFFLAKFFSAPVLANPYFFITGDSTIGTGNHTYYIKMNTDGSQIGALQGVLNYDSTYFSTVQINTQNSQCSIWAPANSVPPGESLTRISPYFYSDSIVFSCGIISTGYNGTTGLILSFTLKALDNGSTSFSFSDGYFAYLGTTISPGAMSDYNIILSGVSTDPDATPTPTPTATPTSATSSATVNTETLFDDVTFSTLTGSSTSTSGTSTTTGSGTSELDVVAPDDSIPAAPAYITPRPAATPYVIPEMMHGEYASGSAYPGEVMSVQSLRDLLIPGKSDADKTVVTINFISTITFLILLAIIIWRMMMNSRGTKLKSQYINEMISGELATLETKMNIVTEKSGKGKFEKEFSESVDHILSEVNPKKEKAEKEEKEK